MVKQPPEFKCPMQHSRKRFEWCNLSGIAWLIRSILVLNLRLLSVPMPNRFTTRSSGPSRPMHAPPGIRHSIVPGHDSLSRSFWAASRWATTGLLYISVTLVGCGGSDGRLGLKGTVTLDGQPLTEGAIVFIPEPGTQGPAAGGKIVDGQFTVAAAKGTMTGAFRVKITALRKTGKKVFDPTAQMQGSGARDELVDELKQYIPARYNSKSELTADVVDGGKNRFEFALDSE